MTERFVPCPSYAIERGVVIDCVLPLGHEGSHDPGEMDGAFRMMPVHPTECGRCGERFADHDAAQAHADRCDRPTMRVAVREAS